MMTARSIAVCGFGVLVLASGVHAQDLLAAHPLQAQTVAQYRNFALKSDLATISAAASVAASTATVVHRRPAVLQDLEVRPSRWMNGASSESTDPVDTMVFSFYNDQLFRIVVNYAQDRTEGMTDRDMVEAISAVYGPPGQSVAGAPHRFSQANDGSGTRIARWGDAEHTIVLYRVSTYGERFWLVVTDSGLEPLAAKAKIEAARLDAQEAPQREIAQQQKEHDDQRAAVAKARVANKRAFRP